MRSDAPGDKGDRNRARLQLADLRLWIGPEFAKVAYTVTELETLNPQAAADIAKRISAAQANAGGRNFRTGGGKVVSMEGPRPPARVAITEWDSLEKVESFFKSKAWTDLGPDRDKALKTIRRYAVEAVQ